MWRSHFWLLGLLLLLIAVPPFLCMELHSDVILFDIYARNLQRGGVAYRDWCETNLPGMAWMHYGIRSVVGWRSEALRAVDLAVFSAILIVLYRWFREIEVRLRLLLVIALLIFYLTLSEWCHVQRDVWMLLPALGALCLRRGQLANWSFKRAFLEGLLWAAAFWIKPHVVVPGLLVWLVSARLARRVQGAPRRRLWLDASAVLAGGLVAGAAGALWLLGTGAWPYFMEVTRVWSREYLIYDVTAGQRWLLIAGFLVRFFPWVLVHLAAVPIALRHLYHSRQMDDTLIAALYLGWLTQALCLQHLFDYVHVPPVLLGFVVVFGSVCGKPASSTAGVQASTPALPASSTPVGRTSFAFFVVACVLFQGPGLFGPRLSAWPWCWSDASSPEVRDRVSGLHKVNWQELDHVAQFLRSRGVHDGELTCFPMPTAALYRELDVEAATRYHFFQNNWLTFRKQRDRIHAEMAASRQRFIVCDLTWEGIELERPDVDLLPPRWQPWKKRITFQSGRYVVLEITGAEGPAWLMECFPD